MSSTVLIILLVGIVVAIWWILSTRDKKEHNIPKKQPSTDSSLSWRVWDELASEQYFRESIGTIDIKQQSFILLKHIIRQQIIGMDEFLHALFMSLLIPKGHVLVEWVPGLAKTKTISCLASALDLTFGRIQCTPDMLPWDITWSEVYDTLNKRFTVMRWPVFAQVLLADELNRTTPKVQSALLEAMEEQQVTIWNETFQLPLPFFVLATQNPLEQEGTYVLPEAQVDRFLCKVVLDYPTLEQEKQMLWVIVENKEVTQAAFSTEDILWWQEEVQQIVVKDELLSYIVRLVAATRSCESLRYGVSPRASIALLHAAKAIARLQWNTMVSYEDVQRVALLVMRHRVALHYTVQAQWKSVDDLLCTELWAVASIASR